MPKKQTLEERQLELQAEQSRKVSSLIHKGISALEKYHTEKLRRLDAPKFRWTLIIFASLLFLIVFGSGFLLFFDKIDKSNFTFLLGILIGAIMALIGDVILEAQQ